MKSLKFVVRGSSLLTLGLVAMACTPGSDHGQSTSQTAAGESDALLPPAVQSLVDSGNAAYREDDFQHALGYFRDALDTAPDHPVPLFGVYLASSALGDTAAADSVGTILRETAPWLLGMMEHSGETTTDPHAALGMGMPADPHAGMVITELSDSQADTTGGA